mmetsp:Transcript_82658/g.229356  ORF Transcript_82658/g.229356 Transcript_82658/m.229356 type:complete len:282 (-) Transcript_82658:418-1263(-)
MRQSSLSGRQKWWRNRAMRGAARAVQAQTSSLPALPLLPLKAVRGHASFWTSRSMHCTRCKSSHSWITCTSAEALGTEGADLETPVFSGQRPVAWSASCSEWTRAVRIGPMTNCSRLTPMARLRAGRLAHSPGSSSSVDRGNLSVLPQANAATRTASVFSSTAMMRWRPYFLATSRWNAFSSSNTPARLLPVQAWCASRSRRTRPASETESSSPRVCAALRHASADSAHASAAASSLACAAARSEATARSRCASSSAPRAPQSDAPPPPPGPSSSPRRRSV